MDKNPDNCHMISLRSLFFVLEDRMQITKLVVETLQPLSTTSNGSSRTKKLWERINTFMKDAASNNLKVEFKV